MNPVRPQLIYKRNDTAKSRSVRKQLDKIEKLSGV